MTDADYDEKMRGGLEKAKGAADDKGGETKSADVEASGEGLEKTEGTAQKNTDRDGKAASGFIEAKKKT